MHTVRQCNINLRQGNVAFGCKRDRLGYLGFCTTRFVLRPVFRQVQPQCNRYWHLLLRQSKRDQYLAVRLLAKHAAMLALDTDRVLALLGQRRVVHDQYGVLAAYQGVSGFAQHLFQGGGGPG